MAWKNEDGQIDLSNLPNQEVRKLTEEELDMYAKKEWKEQEEKHSDDPLEAKRLKNLTGAKTEEGRRKSLQNLRPAKPKKKESSVAHKKVPGMTHGGSVMALLNEEEKALFERRAAKYIEDFDINESSDQVLLTMVVMEEIIYFRYLSYQYQNPKANLDKQITESQNRLRNNLKTLGMTREQRQGTKVNIEHSISDLAAQYMKEIEMLEVQNEDYLKEEEEVLRRQKERDGDEGSIEADHYSSPISKNSEEESG